MNFARIEEGLIFRCVTHSGTVWGSGSLLANRTVLAAPLLKQCLPRQRLRSSRLYVHVGRCLRIRRKRERRPLPEHLPRETHTHMPTEEACSACGGQLSKLGEDVSEMLEYIPASFKVIRHVRPKMCCTCCDVIVQAPAPSRPIDRGLAGPGLLAHVLVSKYADHLPLYRQSEIYAREGVDLDRSTLADWVGAASYLLSPFGRSAA